jgi:DNA ligase-1
MKPLLAVDYDETKLRFPLIAQPKIDGVRALHSTEYGFTSRTLKPFGNRHTMSFFSHPAFCGFDGEMAFGSITSPSLCRNTTSVINRHSGEPFLVWNIFDYIIEDTPYIERYNHAVALINDIKLQYPELAPHLAIVPMRTINSLEELNEYDAENLATGYEGTILRDPSGKYKYGRSTTKEAYLLRIKRFVQEDAVVLSLVEAMENTNEAVINELGRSSRSSHQENMVPKGMVGSLICLDKKTNQQITVGPGELSHEERTHYWLNQSELVGKTISYKYFAHGMKDLPRFPTFSYIRPDNDIV